MNLLIHLTIALVGRASAQEGPLPSSPPSPGKVNWAVIVAGSKDYNNYRHQADACHAYQIMRAKGILEANIIMMAYDDIADSDQNPFPGKLFNKPTAKGVPGTDVYAGCKIDYRGHAVTPENFVKVMTGDGPGKVLKSTSEDNVFVYFVDHGGVGLVYFPGFVAMHRQDMGEALLTMKKKSMFKRLVFYLEACESGSMFEDLDIPGIYAMTAANARESSWGEYCFPNDVVNGKHLGTCLGDEFSIHMLEDFDMETGNSEALEKQYGIVKAETKRSHVSQFGDLSFTSEPVSDFVGKGLGQGANFSSGAAYHGSSVSVWEVHLHNLYQAYRLATTSTQRSTAGKALQAQLMEQQTAEDTFRRIAELSYPGDLSSQEAARRLHGKPNNPSCEKTTHITLRKSCARKFDAGSGFAMQFQQVIVNICGDIARGLKLDLPGIAEKVCLDQDTTLIV
jgi:legumain